MSHGHCLFNGCALTTDLSTWDIGSEQDSTHSVVIGLSFRPLRCSRIWTNTRRVDSVQMEHICRTTPITTKLSSPAGRHWRAEGSGGECRLQTACSG